MLLLHYLLLYATLFHSLSSERNFHVKVTKIDCINSVPGFFKSIKCTLVDRKNVSYISLWMELPKPITTLIMRVALEASMPKRRKLKVLDVKLDACDFLQKSQKQQIMQMGKKYVTKFANRELICPLEANFTYIVKDLFIDVEDLAIFTPELDFRFKFFIFDMNKIAFRHTSEGKVIYNHKVKNMKKVHI